MTPEIIEYRLIEVELAVKRVESKADTAAASVDVKLDGLHDDVLTLKLKARLWGALAGGAVSFVIAVLSAWFGTILRLLPHP